MILIGIVIQGTAYLSALAWLAWRFDRMKGIDAFHLVVAFGIGVLVADGLAAAGWASLPAVAAGGGLAWVVDTAWMRASRVGVRVADGNIIVMIAAASLALLLFDWVTAYAPVAATAARKQLTQVALSAWCFGAVLIVGLSRSRRGRVLRLGRVNQWAPDYWGGATGYPSVIVEFSALGAWFCVLALPLATTGLLSSTLLKDVAMAILLARMAGTRGPVVILAMALTVAALKVTAGYLVTSPIALPVVDATVFISLFLWLRYRSGRTAWTADGSR